MKRNWRNRVGALEKMKAEIGGWLASNFRFHISILILLFLSACAGKETSRGHDTYTCPMHPTVISDRAGSCPVCGMDLVRKAPPGEEVEITEDLSKLIKSPNEVVVASIKTIKGEYKSVPLSIDAVGVVAYDTRNIYSIPARVGGRIEKIFLKYKFQPVTKGQKIAEIYSPELIAAQRELLYLVENDSKNEQLIQGAKSKLLLLGLTASQIDDFIKRKLPGNTVAIYSPYNGYLITDDPVPSTPSSMQASSKSNAGGMDGMTPSSSGNSQTSNKQNISATAGSFLREGNYISAGQTLFKVVNTSALRVELDLLGAQTGVINSGDTVELDLGNGKKEVGTVDFIQPFFNEGQNFLKVRVYTQKTKDLHVGHLVNAKITLKSKEALWIPREAIVDLGNDKIVFVKDGEIFKPKRISPGTISNNFIEIKSGLASSDEIAANANYLVDSESFIKP